MNYARPGDPRFFKRRCLVLTCGVLPMTWSLEKADPALAANMSIAEPCALFSMR